MLPAIVSLSRGLQHRYLRWADKKAPLSMVAGLSDRNFAPHYLLRPATEGAHLKLDLMPQVVSRQAASTVSSDSKTRLM